MAKTVYTDEQKKEWKAEKMAEQRQLLESALSSLTTDTAWVNWVKFGRSNLRKYSFNNALLVWSQKQDARLVHGRKQWEKEKVNLLEDAKPLTILAPVMVNAKDEAGNVIYGDNGKPKKKVAFFRAVRVFDVSDTDAPKDFDTKELFSLDGDDLMDSLAPLEQFARELGYSVEYSENTKGDGHLDQRMYKIEINKNLSGNGLVRTLIHELMHAYGNVNYQDFSREDAEVLVESATVMTLSMIGFDVTKTSVPYIAAWGGDLKVLDKYAKLVEEMVNTLTKKMGV